MKLPHPASAEEMWREDGLYDLVVRSGPQRRSARCRASALRIFLHLAKPDYPPHRGLRGAVPRGPICLKLLRLARLGIAIEIARA